MIKLKKHLDQTLPVFNRYHILYKCEIFKMTIFGDIPKNI